MLFLPHMVLLQDLTCTSHRFFQGSLSFTTPSPLHSFFRRKVQQKPCLSGESHSYFLTVIDSCNVFQESSHHHLLLSVPFWETSKMLSTRTHQHSHNSRRSFGAEDAGWKASVDSLPHSSFLESHREYWAVLAFLMEPTLRNATLETKVSLQKPAMEAPFL